ncbi:chorismate synthase [Rickettsiales endosymbiont of Stachyamoeba lipophora]|uniref:chorismate synthase n=1 Tax=Rickettsiales endosymbiont of Stachyamoeba lipophora TaxID=2486578 RepID=UPI000F64DAB8|nr:chorismate synthase [Rickettsiales endosymbiont of Stachyamoeba lipophora]AZL16198.1 chorismate synthase [Rickettsiales endosymbiont of Stachyamoeba lipophora]
MSNTFGHILKITTWGESHGAAIGAVMDGLPPNIELDVLKDIQPFMDMRRPGGSSYVTKRQETDKVEILSGVFESKTLGTPLSLIIYNQDQQSKDYRELKDVYRPGHADYVYHKKYGHVDYRGGGRASARETAMRVACGAVARKIIPFISFSTQITEIGGMEASLVSEGEIDQVFRTKDVQAALKWQNFIEELRISGDSVGGVVEIRASGIPVGLGSPIFDKLDAEIAKGMMSIPAVKAVEIGAGISCAQSYGSLNNDQMSNGDDLFLSNNSGGIVGGISTGQDIIVRVYFKPTSSIKVTQESINYNQDQVRINIKGRHDPCVALRGWIVAESMLAIILTDYYLWDQILTRYR